MWKECDKGKDDSINNRTDNVYIKKFNVLNPVGANLGIVSNCD